MTTITDQFDRTARPFLTDGGLETTLIFHDGIDLPEFAAFPLLQDARGRTKLRDYLRTYLDIASEFEMGFVLESPTWRANSDWGEKLGYDREGLRAANRLAIADLAELRREYADRIPHMLISGCLGPRGDGYSPTSTMDSRQAEAYHADQVATFADAGADFVSAFTINYVEEAIGVARAARSAGIPSVISFTVETDGCLPTGEPLREAIEKTDAATDGAVSYFMINCAHPTHFEETFQDGGDWTRRIRGVRANASRLSHEELDESETLDDGDPADLADRLRRMQGLLPDLAVFGGCCGTDDRHIRAIGRALLS